MLTRAWSAFIDGPRYPTRAADRRNVRIFGLDLPLRATTVIVAVTLIVLFDFTRTAIPEEVQAIGRAAAAARYQAVTRIVLFLLVPMAIVAFAFRDRPLDYGLRLGNWRWGVGLALVGCVVMTPIVIAIGSSPDFRDYYSVSSASTGDLLTTNVLDLVAAEFLFRGFLMFTLLRAIGPLGIIVAQLPFVFAHLGKPEIELFSTLFGGSVFGWLNWRTGSIWWSALAHVYILTLVVVVASSR
ncbi:MAG: CPBP family intramembrane metalloprotease [Chloroflexi bacterium]|nr:CPBP family intramembrane metalloprotease [Chloroflexota bacterium]